MGMYSDYLYWSVSTVCTVYCCMQVIVTVEATMEAVLTFVCRHQRLPGARVLVQTITESTLTG